MRRKVTAEKVLRHAIPLILLEAIARLGGYILGFAAPDKGVRGEERLRGWLIGLRNDWQVKVVGRGVLLDSPFDINLEQGTALRSGVKIFTGSEGWCQIGRNTHISHNSLLAAAGGITIGENCGISAGVLIYTRTYDRSGGGDLSQAPTRFSPVEIGNGVHIGTGVRILPGVSIGDNAVVGAGAVVTRNVPDGVTVVGVPARPLTN